MKKKQLILLGGLAVAGLLIWHLGKKSAQPPKSGPSQIDPVPQLPEAEALPTRRNAALGRADWRPVKPNWIV